MPRIQDDGEDAGGPEDGRGLCQIGEDESGEKEEEGEDGYGPKRKFVKI
ncbi:MAG TPA: hypothetical protein H9849_09670 [Candidatus Anaerobutyricum stercoripullorum]|uniref:Uncharacterized protein n=1 Tax=Candidatus Anaerobutyricum stercoripullorum TaxID=2838456 RepID=A0A9D1X630_9FIRM|nr:hypothetical protein [Candidatus Anaerobutyricum stercoripullorum]